MSAPFVNSLRSRDQVLVIGSDEGAPGSGAAILHVRVEIPEVWDVVRIDIPAVAPVRALKLNALQALYPRALFPDDFVVKLGGHEIFDEGVSVADTGARDGSVFLVTHRRRRPIR